MNEEVLAIALAALGKAKNAGGKADQTYNPESESAQSGKAVAEAIEQAMSNVGVKKKN